MKPLFFVLLLSLVVLTAGSGCTSLGKMDYGGLITGGRDGWQRPEQVVATLEVATLTPELAARWRYPTPFTALAADGVTVLHGAYWLPGDFDPTRRYPIIDYIYPGPQRGIVPAVAFTDHLGELGQACFQPLAKRARRPGGRRDDGENADGQHGCRYRAGQRRGRTQRRGAQCRVSVSMVVLVELAVVACVPPFLIDLIHS